MVFATFGLEIAESELRVLCDCTIFGTDALKAVDAARQCGFNKSIKANLTSGELEKLIEDGYFPIVYVDLRPIEAKFGFHSLVVVAVDKAEILVLDPACGERILPHSTFATAWASQRNLAIVVER